MALIVTDIITTIIIGPNMELPIVKTIKVPCIDEMGREFDNELCINKITCSKLGIIGDQKCK